ncbi:MAG: type II toxin-antitoxin system RelE/ParE family toxin [Acidobacteria bacterium]|nr:type II toxin-antitoxin system RelE/ParE family toxin [Acidobacteriota bacterium]
MRIVWSPLAVQRLREATEYIARDKPGAAERWVGGAFEAVGRLAELPHSGRVVPELGRTDIREVIYGIYRIIYRVSPEAIFVLTVQPGKQLIDETEVER